MPGLMGTHSGGALCGVGAARVDDGDGSAALSDRGEPAHQVGRGQHRCLGTLRDSRRGSSGGRCDRRRESVRSTYGPKSSALTRLSGHWSTVPGE